MKNIEKLRGVIELFLENSSRINEKSEQKYWYPLSLATYGVDEIIEALDSMCSFRTTMWEKTDKFEKDFAKYVGCSEAVMVNSGSSADLVLSHILKDSIKDSEKNTVIIPAVTWPTQIWSAIQAGFNVRLVDVDINTLNIDIKSLKNAIDDSVVAIFLVHLMGNPCNMSEIKNIINDRDIMVAEDCCEALGASFDNTHVGNFGIGGSYSFFFSHHMTTMEGGMITFNSKKTADKARIIRAHGWSRNINIDNYPSSITTDPRYTFLDLGYNLRPTELQASFGLHQIKKLPAFNKMRDFLSSMFFKHIENKKYLTCPIKTGYPSWLGLPVLVDKSAPFSRDDITSYLESNGVETRPIVAGNIMRHPVSLKINVEVFSSLSGANYIHDYGFYIGLSPMSTKHHVERLIDIFNSFLKIYED